MLQNYYQKRVVNTYIASLDYHFFLLLLWGEHLRFTLFSNFEGYNILLLTLVAMLYIGAPELTHFITRCLYSLAKISLFPPSSAPGNHH